MRFNITPVPSMEAMDFKINTKFAQSFTALMQSVIDQKSKLKSYGFENRRSELFKFFCNNVVDKMLKMIEDFCGYDIEEFGTDTHGYYSFATAFIILDPRKTSIVSVIDAGTQYPLARKAQDSKDLIALAKSFNAAEGNIFPNASEKVKPMIRVGLYFDFNIAFFAGELTDIAELEITAREITAIILHEIGHIMRQIEHAADAYARLNAMKVACANFEANASTDEKIKLLKQVTEMAKKGELTLTPEQSIAIEKVVKDASEIPADEAGSILLPIIRTVFAPLSWIGIIGVLFVDTNSFHSRGKGNSQYYKYSDLPTNLTDFNRSEVQADQYANRHGYGAELVTALDKLDRWSLYCGYGASAIIATKHATLLDKIGRMFACFSEIISAPIVALYENNVYPVGQLRYMEVQKDCIEAMKRGGADPATVAYYLREYESINRIILERSVVNKWGEYGRKLGQFLSYLASIPSIYHLLTDARIDKELNTLIVQLKELSNNNLYYFGTKLKQIANTK